MGGFYASHAAPRPQGSELGLVLEAREGHVLDAGKDYALCIEGDARVAPRAFAGAIVMLLVRPDAEPEQSLAALDAFLAARPAHEAIGALLWTDEGTLTIDVPSHDRARTKARLTRALSEADAQPGSALTVPASAVTTLRSLGPAGEAWFRALVVWAPQASEPVLFSQPSDGYGVSVVGLGMGGASDLPKHAESLGDAVSASFERGFYGLGACATGDLTVRVAGTERAIALPKLASELRAEACDSAQVLRKPGAVKRVEFTFSAAERTVFDQRVADRDKTDFALSVRWHEALPPVVARAHLRGQSSLDCARKSFSVDLEGGQARPFFPGFTSDEFFLVSMCLDEGYVNQTTADRLSRELGIFPFEFELVELHADGASLGPYLMLGEPSDVLGRALGEPLESLVRRRTDIDGKLPELDYARGDEAAALADYEALVSSLEGLSGEALLAEARARMDLDQFLRWVSLMTLLGNGDYVDEVFFYATSSVNPEGKTEPFFSAMGWDPDDLFSACHHSGRFAIVDPHGLLYCAEGVLEHRLFADPVMYAHYVDVLAQVIDQVSEARFEAALGASEDDILALLAQDDLRSAASELLKKHPEAASKDGASTFIRSVTAQMRSDFAAQRKLLLERIAEYRAP